MSNPRIQRVCKTLALEVFQPKPDALYGLDAAARLAGTSRRCLLLYCRAGLIRPVIQLPYGMMEFTEEAIYTARRIERLRVDHGLDMDMVRFVFDLLDEVERLRAEVHFLRMS